MLESITPTESAFTAIDQDWDVVVIGAGPGGSLTAYELAKRGLKTLLIDKSKFPKAKVCGCCLNQDALDSLDKAGLLELDVFKHAPRLTRFNLYTRFGRCSMPLPGGIAISRQALDGTIVQEAIAHGCAFLAETTAKVGSSSEGKRIVTLRRSDAEKSIRATYVVVGDGLSGTALKGEKAFAPQVAPSSRIGIGTLIACRPKSMRPGEIDMYCGEKGYLGMVFVENGMVDTAAAIDRRAITATSDATLVVADIMRACRATVPPEFLEAQWRGTGALTQRRRQVAGDRVFLVGDAAGYTEPFTGQGIAWAMRSALLIAPLLERALKGDLRDPEKTWPSLYKKEIHCHQRTSSLVAMLLRYQRAFSLIVMGVSLFPGALNFFMQRLNRMNKKIEAY